MSTGRYSLAALIMCAAIIICCNEPAGDKGPTLFSSLDSDQTGITFENTITETEQLNILEYEYIYNGGGVAIADFNGDGLQDVFFSGNMVSNALYQNLGNLKFNDISRSAGIEAADHWCSGVSIVDINADGKPDIYLNVNTPGDSTKRRNLLYINQTGADGNVAFTEMAGEYGIDEKGYSVNSAFFDYDNDSDLDLVVIRNQMQDKRNPSSYVYNKTRNFPGRVDKLYRNDGTTNEGHPIFSDVSEEAGILFEGYSLGVNIVDINRDGWKDIYITNDFISEDLLYINNQDGTFTNGAGTYLKHTCHSAMGNDIADINNDGLVDIVALDMLPEDNYRKKTMMGPNNYTTYNYNKRYGYIHQYVRNVLHVNQGQWNDEQLQFSEVAMAAGIEATDWSWAPLVADFDRDGYRDIIITNGFPKDVTDRDFIDYHASNFAFIDQEKLLDRIPEVKIPNYAYRNKGDVTFENVSAEWGLDIPSFSNGGAYVDLDNDGDLDVVVNNIDDPAFVLRNNATTGHYLGIQLEGSEHNPGALGAIVEYTSENHKGVAENSPYRGYLSSMDPVIHIGLGIDTIVDVRVTWPDGKVSETRGQTVDQRIMLKYSEASNQDSDSQVETVMLLTKSEAVPEHIATEEDFIDYNFEPLLFHKLSQYGPGIAVGDYTGDGLEDYYVSGASGQNGQLFAQNSAGGFDPGPELPVDPAKEELGALFFDADGDGDLDLYICSGSNEHKPEDAKYKDVLLMNANGSFIDVSAQIDIPNTSSSCVRAADFDRDGDLDLFVGTRVIPHDYPVAPTSYILKNNSAGGRLEFNVDASQTSLSEIGMISDAVFTDFDSDGLADLIVAGEWMPVTFLKNNNGVLENVTASTGIADHVGWWNSIAPADYDRDGDVDYVVGNYGTNSTVRASEDMPVRIYVADFDENGSVDAIPSVFLKDTVGEYREFAYHGRGDLFKEMIKVKGRFRTHHELGISTIDQLLTPEERQNAMVLEATTLATSYVENLGDGKYKISSMPTETQWSPIYGIVSQDINLDGYLDLIMVGNDYGMEVRTGRMDALNGIVLVGDGTGKFQSVPASESGFYVPGDAKALVSLINQEDLVVMASQNKGPIVGFDTQLAPVFFSPGSEDQKVILHFDEADSQYSVELYHGQGFMSQSTRKVLLPQEITSISVVNFRGETRAIEANSDQLQ